MHLTLRTIIPVVAVISYVLLFFGVATSKPQNAMRSRFRLYLFAMLVWSLAAFIVLQNVGDTLFWFRLMTSSALASMIALFFFTQAAVTKKIRIATYIYIYSLVAILVIQFTHWVISYAEIINGELVYEFTPFVANVDGPD